MNSFIGTLLKHGNVLILYIPNSDVTHTTKKSGVVRSHTHTKSSKVIMENEGT